MDEVELRCDQEPFRQLLAKVRQPKIVDGNLIELSCRDCRKAYGVKSCVHRFDVTGELIETECVRHDGSHAMM